MSAVLERMRLQLGELQEEIEAEVASRHQASLAALEQRHADELAAMQAQCAEAMEHVYSEAAKAVEGDRPALIAEGKRMERERLLLLIQLVGEQLRQDGSNAQALLTLRRMVEGDVIRHETRPGDGGGPRFIPLPHPSLTLAACVETTKGNVPSMQFTATTKEAVRILRTSEATLRRLRRAGVLRPGIDYCANGAGRKSPTLLWAPETVRETLAQRSRHVFVCDAQSWAVEGDAIDG